MNIHLTSQPSHLDTIAQNLQPWEHLVLSKLNVNTKLSNNKQFQLILKHKWQVDNTSRAASQDDPVVYRYTADSKMYKITYRRISTTNFFSLVDKSSIQSISIVYKLLLHILKGIFLFTNRALLRTTAEQRQVKHYAHARIAENYCTITTQAWSLAVIGWLSLAGDWWLTNLAVIGWLSQADQSRTTACSRVGSNLVYTRCSGLLI